MTETLLRPFASGIRQSGAHSRKNPSVMGWRAAIRWARRGLLTLASGLMIGNAVILSSVAAESTTREIKRLLWVLDYGADRINDDMTGETSKRIRDFLKARGKDGLAGDSLLAELRSAVADETVKARSANSQIVDRAPLLQSRYGDGAFEIFPDDNVVMAGTCPINRARLSDGAPLKAFKHCGTSFRVSRSLNLIVNHARWSGDINGLLLADAKSGLRKDFIEVPDAGPFSRLGLSPDGKEAMILTTKTDVWRVDLETRSVSKVAHHANSVTNSLQYSPDGRFFAYARSDVAQKFRKYLVVWSRNSNRQTFEAQAENSAFSSDGSLIAIEMASSTLEIRDTSTGRTIHRKKFDNESPSIKSNDESTAFNRDNTGLYFTDYDGIIREWNFQTGAVTEKLKPRVEPERALIRANEGKVYTIEGATIGIYALDKQANDKQAKEEQVSKADVAPTRLKIKGGAVSSDKTLLAAYGNDTIKLVDIQTGKVLPSPSIDVKKITAIAFIPGSTDLLIGTEEGEIFAIENGTTRRIVKHSGSISAIWVARQRQILAAKSDKKIIVTDIQNGRPLVQTTVEGYNVTASSLAFVDDDRRLLFTDTNGKAYRAVTLDIASGSRGLNYEMRSNVKRNGTRTTWMKAWIGFITASKADPGLYWVGGKSWGSDILYQYSNGRFTPRHGSPEGTVTFYPASAGVADTFQDGGLLVALGKRPKVSSVDGDNYLSQHLEMVDDPVVVSAISLDRFVSLDESGEVRIYSRKDTEPLVRTILYEGGDWLSRTERGFFAGTKPAAANLFLAQGSTGAVSLDSVFDALYRPDLVSEAAVGDPNGKMKTAAASLDLEKVLASGPTPTVAIVSPAASSSSSFDEIEVQASVTDRGGGIGKVEWRVNGITLGVEERGLMRLSSVPAGGSTLHTIRRKLVLEPGDNRIELIAYNSKNLIASEVSKISVKWNGEHTAAPPKLYVLAVGVNDYFDSRLRLAYAVPDATALADGFDRAGAGLYAGTEVIKVLDAKVTAENLDKVFSELGAKVQPRDVFVFFLAGHGKTKNGRYYFLPRDFRYEDEGSVEKSGIGQDKFQAWFAKVAARKSILLYDTCESGSLTSANARGTNLDERLGAMNRMARATGRTFLTATTDDAPALEGFRGHGVFTYALLEGIDRADVNKNGLIEVSELADFIDQMVPDYSYEAFKLRQVPQRSIVGNNFPIVAKASLLQTAAASPALIPSKPTHVVVSQLPVDVYADAARGQAVVEHLRPGTTVTLIETGTDWILIAKDGKKLGYVQKTGLAELN